MKKIIQFKDRFPTSTEINISTYQSNNFNFIGNSFDGQDNYVVDLLNKKTNGFYIEIGASHPKHGSNTFLFEKTLNWTGILIEYNPTYFQLLDQERPQSKICKCKIVSDKSNISNQKTICEIFKEYENYIPTFIDYVSLDIDDPELQFKILEQFNHEKYKIGILVVEHDIHSDIDTLNKGKEPIRNKYRNLIDDLLKTKDYIYDGNIYVNDAYIHKSIYDTIIKNKNDKYDYSLPFNL